jgi:5'(3')-deoxyribonucleotidase
MGDMRSTPAEVGVDIDGVLCDHVRGLCVRILERYGIRLTVDMVTEWDLHFGPSSIAQEVQIAYKDDGFLLSLLPVAGAQEAVSRLAGLRDLRLSAVTSRPAETQSATTRWLGQYFPSLPLTHTACKERLPIDVLVDDFPPFVERFAAAGKVGILFSQPWNAAEQERLRHLPRIAVVHGWHQGAHTLERLMRTVDV